MLFSGSIGWAREALRVHAVILSKPSIFVFTLCLHILCGCVFISVSQVAGLTEL